MRNMLIGVWGLCLSAAPCLAVPLGPNSGAVSVTGTLNDHDSNSGQFSIQAVLKDGNFTGNGQMSVGKSQVAGPLNTRQSYYENGKCYFRWESGGSRAAISGVCDGTRLSGGRMESFVPSDGSKNGEAQGTIVVGGAGKASRASAAGILPTAKLTCAYTDRRIGVAAGQTTQYSLAFSNMVSLSLSPGGTYQTGKGSGRYSREGNQIRLTSGKWAGAIGSLEADRSGEPAVVFPIEQNRLPSGVHRIDPYTTRCTRSH